TSSPAKLLCNLEGEGLAAFGVIRPQIDVDEGPAELIGDLGAQAIHVVVVAVDRDEGWLVDRRAEDLPLLQVGRDEDAGADAGAGSVRRDRASEIAGRGAGERVEAQLDRLRAGHRYRPVLEGERRIDRVVLDVQLAQPELARQVVRPDQRRQTGADVDDPIALDRQEVAVAPDRLRPGR